MDGSVGLSVALSVHPFGPDLIISTTPGWIALKECADIHGPWRMSPYDSSITIMKLAFMFLCEMSSHVLDRLPKKMLYKHYCPSDDE